MQILNFVKAKEGNVATLFALFLIPLLAFVGMAADYGVYVRNQAELQKAVDIATLDSMPTGISEIQATAAANIGSRIFSATTSLIFATTPTISFTLNSDGSYTGSASAIQATRFLGLVGISGLTLAAKATAAAKTVDNSCVLALAKGLSTSTAAITFNGAPNVSLSGCSLQSNASVTCNGHGGQADQTIAVGTAAGCTNPATGSAVLDVYAAAAANISKKCGGKTGGVNWSAGQVPSSLNVYSVSYSSYTEYHICGDLTLSGSGTADGKSGPSVLVIENGNLVTAASVTLSKASIVLTGDNSSSHTLNLSGTFAISAPTDRTVPWHGLALYQDPALSSGVDVTIGSNTTLALDGVAYLPNANMQMQGHSGGNMANCGKLVVNTLVVGGSVNFSRSAASCANSAVDQVSSPTLIN